MPNIRLLLKKKSYHKQGEGVEEIKTDSDNDKKELEKVITNKDANNKLISMVKQITIKPNRRKKFINLDIDK